MADPSFHDFSILFLGENDDFSIGFYIENHDFSIEIPVENDDFSIEILAENHDFSINAPARRAFRPPGGWLGAKKPQYGGRTAALFV